MSDTSSSWGTLTQTELKVVALVTEGLTDPEIAERLTVSPWTVQTHLKRIFKKLGVRGRAELAATAARRGAGGSGYTSDEGRRPSTAPEPSRHTARRAPPVSRRSK